MPTGTGKGGVIAGIARAVKDVNCVLVVTPWSVLRDQIVDEISLPWTTPSKAKKNPQEWPAADVRSAVGQQ
jgi:superfamily II DNA or RNA helicase